MRVNKGTSRVSVSHPFVATLSLNKTAGILAADGIQFSPIATVGTAAVNNTIFDELLDPGVIVRTTKIKAHIEYNFEGLNGSFVASLGIYFQLGSDGERPSPTGAGVFRVTGDLINISGSLQTNIGTLVSLNGTLDGLIPVGSVPYFPARLKLIAYGIRDGAAKGKLINSSSIELIGEVIPGA